MAVKFNRTSAHADIEKLRTAISSLKVEAEWLKNAPMPKSDLLVKMGKWVDQLANESDSIRQIMFDDDSRGFLQVPSKVDYEGHGRSATLGPLLCELFTDQIKDTLAKKIEILDYEHGPELSERPGLLKQNAAQIKELEIAEESLTVEAEKVGIAVPRRADLSPEIFLEIDKFPPLPEVPESLGAIEYRERQAGLQAMAETRDRANGARMVVERSDTNFEIN